jgi:16S rRNA (cytosine1402-N4)-methyltransferase
MLQPAPGRTVYDATFGRGGHTRAFLQRGARVVAIDVDPAAEAEAQKLLAEVGPDQFCFHRANFSDLEKVAAKEGQADGLLLDLGISSPQVDQAERGFSFQQSGPLDMRMDPTSGATAADLVNNLSEPELRNLLREGGEDRDPGRIARGIVRARPLATTLDLATAVCRATRPARPGAKHPATRTFLALRRAVRFLKPGATPVGKIEGQRGEGDEEPKRRRDERCESGSRVFETARGSPRRLNYGGNSRSNRRALTETRGARSA